MPTYEYRCDACGHQFEEVQKISDPPLERCPKCKKKKARRQISQGNFILKGGGWYVTDYKKSGAAGKRSKESESDSGEVKAEAKADTKSDKKSDAKSETKSDTKSETRSDTKSEGKSSDKPAKKVSKGE